MDNLKRFNKITKDIKEIKIQGARNVAKSALYAYYLFPNKKTIKILKSLRPTEPMLFNVLNLVEKKSKKEILNHFNSSQERINQIVFSLIKNNDLLFTHCHSTNVINSLIFSKKNGKIFSVYNTETRPLFQGRKTAKELSDNKIKVTMFIDSALASIFEKKKKDQKVSKIFLGSDALLDKGIINKVGSLSIAKLSYQNKIPLYIIADSWKYSPKKIKIENRDLNEVWDKAPENIKIKNPAFEFVDKKYINKIITEYGIMNYSDFLKRVKK